MALFFLLIGPLRLVWKPAYLVRYGVLVRAGNGPAPRLGTDRLVRKEVILATNADEFIDVDAVETSPRGRKPVLDATLLGILKKVPNGKAVRLAGTFGNVPKDQRSAASATIRKHWNAAHPGVKPRIDFTAEGVPQVRAR